MPGPFDWDITKPSGQSSIRFGDDQIRADKDTLRKVLGTLTPFGVTTTGWRAVQVGDETWLTQNASYDGTNWNRDDTTKGAVALRMNANGTLVYLSAPAGDNPITWSSGVASGLNADLLDGLHASDVGIQLLRDTVVTADVTSLTWDNLGLGSDVGLLFFGSVVNNRTSVVEIHARVNGEPDSSDWHLQYLDVHGTTLVANVVPQSSSVASSPSKSVTMNVADINVVAGKIMIFRRVVRMASPNLTLVGVRKNTGVTSITRIDLVAEVTDGIQAGSHFRLYKLWG